ncbi:flagellin [Rhizobium sp. GCM10022189]|uniref:flagellin N-terminal helical domain-containing protein n=1 Tax=Rhizobium sp. GCM10022189 TaxID=3252654 RepID=UPI000DD68C8C
MSSIITNNSAIAALQTLRNVSSSLQDTQQRVSSGYRVEKAADNAAYWSIATTMRSDNKAMSAVSDALGLGAAKVDTAYTAMSNAIDVVDEIKAKLVAASEKGVDRSKLQDEIDQLQDQLMSIAQSATFAGENWMMGTHGTSRSVVTSFVRDGNGNVKVMTTDYSVVAVYTGDSNTLFGSAVTGSLGMTSTGILGLSFGNLSGQSVYEMDITTLTTGGLADALQDVENALRQMSSTASELGSLQKRISMQEDFVSNLSDSIDSGVGRLVDANMEAESSQLSALQTQQQLAVQSLSIANSAPQNILSLFRG